MVLQKLSPILWTKNLQETILFYESILGFTCCNNFPNFASLSRDHVEIMIIEPTPEPEDCENPLNNQEAFFPKPKLTGSIYIFSDNVDELWEKVKDKAIIKSDIADRAYWMRDFSILDNNGYELVFGQDISSQQKV
ncbi:Glyoxalase/Bleomycin resistance protein/Dioxygenase superfamily protein [Pseudarcicella hirudinis]|uniref:Glyoxalase/Bleomycin resistance protein/Dioxygenase superfamily protein n=1 Tax=Pseudarcicella hirudinis TaxID=1079859 RepID=A0A1I5M418_9BACT|nr:Glyoxalase/Bleomycin resistance protein/Dioxygenase superfamily protein [Pseudarcicella hirudinis]